MGVLHDTSRKVRASDFVGKTIKSLNTRADNVLAFTFTDGTYLEIWSEVAPGGIAVMEVDPNAEPTKHRKEAA